jgi:hypothetical protein
MEAVRFNVGATLAAAAVFSVIGATVLCQQIEIKKGKPHMPTNSNVKFPSAGSSSVSLSVNLARVEIDNGRIDCKLAEDGKSRVEWEVVSRPGTSSELMEVIVTEEDGELHVKDIWHGKKWGQKPEVRITAWLPGSTNLDLALGNGNATTALSGRLNAAVGNGDLRLAGAPTSLRVSLGNGHLRGSAKLATGYSAVQLGNGNIELQLLDGSDTRIKATTATGRVKTTGIAGEFASPQWVGSRYNGKIGSGAGALTLEVGNGNVRLESGAAQS